MPQPADVDAAAEALLAVYRTAQDHLDAEMRAIADNPAAYRRRSRLAEMQSRVNYLMDHVDQQARAWIEGDLPSVYELGASRAQQAIADAVSSLTGQAAPTLNGFNQVPRDAVNRLAGDLHENLLEATSYVRDSTKSMIREVVRSGVLDTIVTGTPALEASRQVAKLLDENGIHSITYADGTRMSLDTYAEMAVRTSSALIYNQGTFDEATGSGVEYLEVFDGENCGWLEHEDPDLADGSIRTLTECEDNPLAHPNCRRGFGPRPDVVSDEQAAAAQAGGGSDGEGVAPEDASLAQQLGLPVTGVSEAVAFGIQDEAAQQRELVAQAGLDRHAQRLQSRQDRLDSRSRRLSRPGPVDEPGDAAASLVTEAAGVEPAVTADVVAMAQEAGGTMEGFDYRLKTEESLRRKLVTDAAETEGAMSVTDVANQVGDVLRYTATFDAVDYTAGVGSTVDALRARGYRVVKVKNSWFPADSPYRGINSTLVAPTGERFELQFHTPDSFALKQASHAPYERVRKLPRDSAERERLVRQMGEDAAALTAPDGVEGLSIDSLGG